MCFNEGIKTLWANIKIVVWKELKEHSRKNYLLFMMIFVSVIFCINIALVSYVMVGKSLGSESMIQILVNTLFTHQAFSMYFVFCFMTLITLFYKEKQNKTLEYLLTTPLGPRQILLGKSVFMLFCGLIPSYFITIIGLFMINLIANSTSSFIMPNAPAITIFFVCLPILAFMICLLMGLVYLLLPNPIISNMVFILIGMGFMVLSYARMGQMNTNWLYVIFYLAFGVVLFIPIYIMFRNLIPEKIIMSDK